MLMFEFPERHNLNSEIPEVSVGNIAYEDLGPIEQEEMRRADRIEAELRRRFKKEKRKRDDD